MSDGNAAMPLSPAQEGRSAGLRLPLLYYGSAVLGIAFAALLRALFTPWLGDAFPYATFVLTVMILAYYCGLWPALLATLLGALTGVYLFLPPYHSFVLHKPLDFLGMGVYCFICIGISGLIESLRKSRANAKAHAREAEQQREQMEQEVRQRKEAEAQLRTQQEHVEALNTKLRLMMREIQDRVRNNLQVITALAEIQATGEETVPTSAIQRIGQHGQVLAAIHEMIGQSLQQPEEEHDLSIQELGAKIALLARNVLGTRQMKLKVSEGRLNISQMTAVALLLNELISNAVQHGQGEIELLLALENGSVHLEMRDQGPGFPEGFDPAQAAQTGIQLIENYARWDLQGQIFYDNRPEGGARVRVTFPLSPSVTAVVKSEAKPLLEHDTLKIA